MSLGALTHGATVSWDAGDGSFQDSSNWDPAVVPGVGDDVVLLGSNPVTITFAAGATVDRILLTGTGSDSADYSLALGGNTLAASFEPSVLFAAALEVNVPSGGSSGRELAISGGTLSVTNLTLNTSTSGTLADPASIVRVTGSGTVLNVTGTATEGPTEIWTTIARSGRGEVYVEQGGVWNIAGSALFIGHQNSGASGLLQVSGAGSAVNALSNASGSDRISVNVGSHAGAGTLNVLNGGYFETDDLSIARGPTSTGAALADGLDSGIFARRVFVGGGLWNGGSNPAAGGVGSLTVDNDGLVEVSELFRVYSQGTVEIDGGSIEIGGTAAAEFLAGSTLEITLDSIDIDVPVTALNGLTITNSNLSILLGEDFSAAVDDTFNLLSYGTLTGLFDGKADESTFEVGGYTFRIDYGSGSSDMIQLTVIPEPGVVALFSGILVAVATSLVRRRKC